MSPQPLLHHHPRLLWQMHLGLPRFLIIFSKQNKNHQKPLRLLAFHPLLFFCSTRLPGFPAHSPRRLQNPPMAALVQKQQITMAASYSMIQIDLLRVKNSPKGSHRFGNEDLNAVVLGVFFVIRKYKQHSQNAPPSTHTWRGTLLWWGQSVTTRSHWFFSQEHVEMRLTKLRELTLFWLTSIGEDTAVLVGLKDYDIPVLCLCHFLKDTKLQTA